MFIITKKQIELFEHDKLRKFILLQIINLRSKLPEKVLQYSDLELFQIIEEIINWGLIFKIEKSIEVEYLINVCVKYALSIEYLKSSKLVNEIFNYPDRKTIDKIFHLHYLVESEK